MEAIDVINLKRGADGIISADVKWDRFPEKYAPASIQPHMSEHFQVLYDQVMDGTWGTIEEYVAPEVTAEEKLSIIKTTVQAHLDTMAKEKGYDSIASAVTYADEPSVPAFQTEGQAFRAWRSLVWESCYNMLSEYEAGNISEPTPEEVIAQLPTLSL